MTVSEETEVPEAEDLVLESTEPADRGLVVEDRDEEDRHEEAKLRKGGLLRDKAMASTAGVREIQVKLDTGYEELQKSRTELLLLKRSILLKRQEMSTLLREEIRAEETVDLWAKKVANWESTKAVLWMGCVDNITGLACHVTDMPTFASSDARPALAKNLVKIDARLAMEKARKKTPREPREQADYSLVVKQGANGREVELKAPLAVKEPGRKPVVAKERRPDQEQWTTAGGRRGQGQNRNGKAMLLLHKDKIPPAGKYRYAVSFTPNR